MDERSGRGFDRRTVLKVGGMLGVGGALAGCVEGVNPLSDSDSDTDSKTNGGAGVIPQSAQGLAYGNVDAFLADSNLREGINQQLQTLGEQTGGYSGPTTVEEYLAEMEESAGVDVRDIHEVVGFWGPNTGTGAVVLWTDWPESAVTSQLSDYSEESYHGTTLYVQEYGGPGANLGDGVYAVGSSEAVRSVIDVRDGRAQNLSGQLRQTYDTTQGMTRLAVDVPDLSMEDLTGAEASSGSQVQQTANSLLQTVEYAAGSVHKDGTNRVMEVTLVTESADDAKALDGSLSAGRQLAMDQLETMRSESQSGSTERLLIDRMVTFGRDSDISQNGETVEVRYAAPPTEFVRNGPALLLASGVFINTAGFLQTRAEETGQESTSQVTNRLQFMNAVGEVVDGEIGVVRLTAGKAPGSGDIDLQNAIVQAVTPDTIQDITYDGQGGENFGVEPLKDDDGSIGDSGVLNSAEDRAALIFDIGSDEVPGVDTSSLNRFSPGESALFTVITGAGGETEVEITVPDTLAGEDVVNL